MRHPLNIEFNLFGLTRCDVNSRPPDVAEAITTLVGCWWMKCANTSLTGIGFSGDTELTGVTPVTGAHVTGDSF